MKTINNVIDWYVDSPLWIKCILFLPVFIIVALLYAVFGDNNSDEILGKYKDHLEKDEEKIKYEIEAHEKEINSIDDKIKDNKETVDEKINSIDTFDSFDDVYNSVVGK